jgi:hypothetical protein
MSGWSSYAVQGVAHHPTGGGGNGGNSYPDGTFVQASDTGHLYEMAGGSPMYVTSTSAVPWTGSYQATTQAAINAMPMYPLDGAVLQNHSTGALYVVAGGYPFRVMSMSAIPPADAGAVVSIDGWDISNSLRSQPANGTVVRDYSTGAVYVIAGDSPMRVMSMNNIPYTTYTDVDEWAINNELSHYPQNGTVIIDYTRSGNVYVIAGGSPMYVHSMSAIPAPSSTTYVDDWAVQNQLRQYPLDGTVIQNYSTGSLYVVAGGAPLYITSQSSFPPTGDIPVDGSSIANLLAYPLNGTFVVGYVSKRAYQIQNQAAVYIGNSSLITSPPVTVDDWAITNELHGS